MILYENRGLTFVSIKWKALVNFPNIALAISVFGWVLVGIMDDWSFLFWFLSIYVLILAGSRIYYIRKARPRIIETLDDSLRIVYDKYFLSREVKIQNEDVKIELYESPYRGRFGTKVLYLYFYSHSNSAIDIELTKDFYTLGKLLSQIHDEQKIHLGPKELVLVGQYRERVEWNKSTKGKIMNILFVLAMVALLILLFYYFR